MSLTVWLSTATFGNGLLVRAAPNRQSAGLGVLLNRQKVFQSALSAVITTDKSGRQWMAVDNNSSKGWTSLAASPGQHTNFTLCTPDM